MNKAFLAVKLFHTVFGHPVASRPKMMDVERAQVRAKWMQEEIQEFLEAKTLVDQVDALIDLIYFAVGTFVEMGVTPEGPFNCVQDANMAKVWPDGQLHKNADGKTIKPPGWTGPEERIAAELERQCMPSDSIVPEDLPPVEGTGDIWLEVIQDATQIDIDVDVDFSSGNRFYRTAKNPINTDTQAFYDRLLNDGYGQFCKLLQLDPRYPASLQRFTWAMEQRREFGIKKYGKPLQRGNGRKFDLIGEILDCLVYAKQLISDNREIDLP